MTLQRPNWMLQMIGLLLTASVVGCGVRPIPVQGVLTVDGKPLAKASVMFVSDDADGKTASGITDESGVFRLTTFTLNDGAMRGAYKVVVTHSEPVVVPAEIKDPDEQKAFVASQSRKSSIVPEVYSSQDKTPLKHRVPEDGNAKIEISRAK